MKRLAQVRKHLHSYPLQPIFLIGSFPFTLWICILEVCTFFSHVCLCAHVQAPSCLKGESWEATPFGFSLYLHTVFQQVIVRKLSRA